MCQILEKFSTWQHFQADLLSKVKVPSSSCYQPSQSTVRTRTLQHYSMVVTPIRHAPLTISHDVSLLSELNSTRYSAGKRSLVTQPRQKQKMWRNRGTFERNWWANLSTRCLLTFGEFGHLSLSGPNPYCPFYAVPSSSNKRESGGANLLLANWSQAARSPEVIALSGAVLYLTLLYSRAISPVSDLKLRFNLHSHYAVNCSLSQRLPYLPTRTTAWPRSNCSDLPNVRCI